MGIAGYVTGLVLSSLFGLPTGAVIVVTLVIAFVVAMLLAGVRPSHRSAQ